MTKELIKPSDKIFVAGSRGMAGSAVVRALKKKGYGDVNNRGELLTPNRKDLELLNQSDVNDWMAKYKPDVVVLAAATVGGIEANRKRPADFILDNLKIETGVIEAAWKNGVRRLLFLGSSCIYPKLTTQPIREEQLLTGSLEPTNAWYAIAKISGIKLCEALRIQHGFDAISLMPTNLYGPGDNYHSNNSHVLPAMIRKFHEAKSKGCKEVTCWGTGKPLREFLYADDLGEACVFALEKWSTLSDDAPRDEKGELLSFLNVGTGIDLKISDLAEQVADTVGFEGKIQWDHNKPDGTPKKQLDVTRLRKMGWEKRIDLSEGLKMAYDDFMVQLRENRLRE